MPIPRLVQALPTLLLLPTAYCLLPTILREIRLPISVPKAGKRVGHIGMAGDRFFIQLEAKAGRVVEHELAIL